MVKYFKTFQSMNDRMCKYLDIYATWTVSISAHSSN